MINLIRQKMIESLKAGKKEERQVYANILNALTNKAKDLRKQNLTQEESNEVIVKMNKMLHESLDTCPDSRVDIKKNIEFELNIVNQFMPEQMNENQIEEIIKSVLSELNLTSPTIKDKGKIMKMLMPKVKGKADGKMVNSVLGQFL